MKKPVASALLVVVAALLALVRLLDPGAARDARVPVPDVQPRVHVTAPPTLPAGDSERAPAGSLDLASIDDERMADQIRTVIDSFDRTGHPPPGVAQGGRRNGPKGLFDNAQGKLPRQPRGYYTETDIWPREPGKNRGTYRLILGRGREVYYTGDHYNTFTRLR